MVDPTCICTKLILNLYDFHKDLNVKWFKNMGTKELGTLSQNQSRVPK